MLRICRTCKKSKLPSDFPVHSECRDGLSRQCRDCKNAYMRSRRKLSEVRAKDLAARRKWYDNGGREKVRQNTKSFRRRTGYPGWSDLIAHKTRNLT